MLARLGQNFKYVLRISQELGHCTVNARVYFTACRVVNISKQSFQQPLHCLDITKIPSSYDSGGGRKETILRIPCSNMNSFSSCNQVILEFLNSLVI